MKTGQHGKSGVCRAVSVALLYMAVLCVCEGTGEKTQGNELKKQKFGTFPGLDVKTERRILQDYYDTYIKPVPANSSVTVNDLSIINYYGTYNAVVVVKIEDGVPFDLPTILPRPYNIDDIVFPWLYPSRPFPTVWNNGQFYSIQELYASGLLTRNDLESIAGHPKEYDEFY
jgi:hypothetical protein